MERTKFEQLFRIVEHTQAVERSFFQAGEKERLYRFLCGELTREQLWSDTAFSPSAEPYLQNYFHIDRRELAAFERCERMATSARLVEALIDPAKVAGDFSVRHYQAIHRYLFQDVFPWAGQWRNVDISKGTSTFAHFRQIDTMAHHVFAQLRAMNDLRGMSAEEFGRSLAILLGDLNALHPFREGNGRSTRLFVELLAEQAGWSFRFSDIEAEQLLSAMIASLRDETLLIRCISDVIVACPQKGSL